MWENLKGAVLENGITAPVTGLTSKFILEFAGTGFTLKAISTCSFSSSIVTAVIPLSFAVNVDRSAVVP